MLVCQFSVPNTSIRTSISSIGLPVAGYNHSFICTVTLTEGLLHNPRVWWVDSDGQRITSGGDVMVYDPVTAGLTTNLTLFFDPIRTSDSGTYICMASVLSPALNGALNSSTNNSVNIYSKNNNFITMVKGMACSSYLQFIPFW